MRLEGKRVLITGTAGGQGEAAQALFAREGARICGCDVREGAAESTAETLRAEGFDVSGASVDLGDPEAAAAWVEESADRLGGIDVLYNNASRTILAPIEDMTVEMWRDVMRNELDIIFYVTQPAWKHLKAAGNASIISTGSLSGLRGLATPGQVAHAAAKGGVIAVTRAFAAEGAAHGIRANAISPGLIMTPGVGMLGPEQLEQAVSIHLIRRPGLPEEVASLALYLASDESSWVTGQNYSIDGGASAGSR